MPAHQVSQQLELALGEHYVRVSPGRPASVEVEPQAAVLEIAAVLVMCRRATGETASDSRDELSRMERLGHEVDGAEVQRVDAGRDVRHGGQHNHRSGEATFAQL